MKPDGISPARAAERASRQKFDIGAA